MGARSREWGIDGAAQVTEGWGDSREVKQVSVRVWRLTRVELERPVLRLEALVERAFVVKWASRGGSRWSERRGVFLPRAEYGDGRTTRISPRWGRSLMHLTWLTEVGGGHQKVTGLHASIKGRAVPEPRSFPFCLSGAGFLLDLPGEEGPNAAGTGGALAGLFCLPEAA